jgi:hypothetical protein
MAIIGRDRRVDGRGCAGCGDEWSLLWLLLMLRLLLLGRFVLLRRIDNE